MIKRRKIDDRLISSLRPDVSRRDSIEAYMLLDALTRFSDEYLRAAMVLTVEGTSSSILNISLEGVAYLLRLMVECGSERAMLRVKISVADHLTLDAEFPEGLPETEDLSRIAAAGRSAGLHFEVRGNRLLFRTSLAKNEKISVYFGSTDKFYDALVKIFFG